MRNILPIKQIIKTEEQIPNPILQHTVQNKISRPLYGARHPILAS